MDQLQISIATTPDDLLKVMVVRGIVFVEEQQVAWEGEFDEFDKESVHLLALAGGQPVGAGRLRMLADGWAKLERIAVRPAWRGRGIAHAIVKRLLAEAATLGATRCKLHAQVYLEDFYARYGFRREGEVFNECDIDHILMLRDSSCTEGGG